MRTSILICLGAITLAMASAGEPGRAGAPRKVERKGPLAGLPSAPGPHLEKIKTLGDNEWVDLGSPAADPKWGRARGRSWGMRGLVLAPGLRGAFLYGEGPHAYVKPDGYAHDDLWFYDINAHRWICLYPGMHPKSFAQRVESGELRLDDKGQLIDKDGQPLPVHTNVHAWGYLTYNPDEGKFVWMGWGGNGLGEYYLPGLKDMKSGLTLLAEQAKRLRLPNKGDPWHEENPVPRSPWCYNAHTGKFERMLSASSHDVGGFPYFVYVPSKKQYYIAGPASRSERGAVAVFDPGARTWAAVNATGVALGGGYDLGSCLDPKRDRIYFNSWNGFVAYDIESRTWLKLDPKGTGPEVMNDSSAFQRFVYDPVRDLVVVIQFRSQDNKKPELNGVHAYDPRSNTWSGPTPLPDSLRRVDVSAANVCFDPDLNAIFCFFATDGADNGRMWAYRYKKAAGK